MRFHNKYDGPPKNFGHQIFAYGRKSNRVFKSVLFPMGFPLPPSGGKINRPQCIGISRDSILQLICVTLKKIIPI